MALHRAARLWALSQLDAGRVTVDRLSEALSGNVYVAHDGRSASLAIQAGTNGLARLRGPQSSLAEAKALSVPMLASPLLPPKL